MQIAIMGAGAVGCYYAALLARAGHAVTLIGRTNHIEAIHRQGLILETASRRETFEVSASVDVSALKDAELVLFCVKATDTEAAGAAMAPMLSDNAIILSLQNGVDNAERLAALLGRAVMPVGVYRGGHGRTGARAPLRSR